MTVAVLFGEPDLPKNQPPDRCFIWARRLYKAVKKARLNYSVHSMRKWAEQFALLEKDLGKLKLDTCVQPPYINKSLQTLYPPLKGDIRGFATKTIGNKKRKKTPTDQSLVCFQIEKVLSWYEKHIAEKYTPLCDSAKSFRQKFPRIIVCMTRSVDTEIPITPEISSLLTRIGNGWKEPSKSQLPFVIQSSYNSIKRFRERVWNFMAENGLDERNKPNPHDKLRTFAKERVLPYITYTALIEEPMIRLRNRLSHREDWSHDLGGSVVNINSEPFQEFGRAAWVRFGQTLERTHDRNGEMTMGRHHRSRNKLSPPAKAFEDYTEAYNKGVENGKEEFRQALVKWLNDYCLRTFAAHVQTHGNLFYKVSPLGLLSADLPNAKIGGEIPQPEGDRPANAKIGAVSGDLCRRCGEFHANDENCPILRGLSL